MQAQIAKEQEKLTVDQLRLSEKVAYQHIDPDVDCELDFPEKIEKGDPFIIIINKSPIKAKMVFIEAFLIGITGKGECLAPLMRRTYPGHLFFKEELKPFEYSKCGVMSLPRTSVRPKDIIKFAYVFELVYRRETDMKEYKKFVIYEIDDLKAFKMIQVEKIESYKFYNGIKEQIDLAKRILKDNPEEFLKY